ncbi:TonB-dependent receptor plug domain-containing protein, partial [Actinomadura sp. DSM 109109]|nr:TonB-dependent receptor plug domain-containing protein [Actinomadura lepetitiana]
VLSAATLADNRVSGLEQLSQVSPSISFTNSANTRGQGLAIRGIGTLNFSDGVEPSVSTVIDGVVIGRSAASFFDFNDISRIEVLRGPQGTLYGARSMGGTVRLITRQPDVNEFSGSAHGIISSTRHGGANGTIDGSLNIPIVADTLAIRAFAFGDYQSGV